jgi:hypothetical protein
LKVRVLKSDEYAGAIIVEVIGDKAGNFRMTFKELSDGTIISSIAPFAGKEQEIGKFG